MRPQSAAEASVAGGTGTRAGRGHDVPFKGGGRNCLKRANVALVVRSGDVRCPFGSRDGADDVGSEGVGATKEKSPARQAHRREEGGRC